MLMFLKKMRKSKRGFTLTELIVVVAILGVLAAVATPMVMGQVTNARIQADNANMRMLEDSIKRQVVMGDSTLGTDLNKAAIVAAISSEVPVIPNPQVTTNAFYVDKSTGGVSTSATSSGGAANVQIAP